VKLRIRLIHKTREETKKAMANDRQKLQAYAPEKLARQVEREARREDRSISAFICRVLEREMKVRRTYSSNSKARPDRGAA